MEDTANITCQSNNVIVKSKTALVSTATDSLLFIIICRTSNAPSERSSKIVHDLWIDGLLDASHLCHSLLHLIVYDTMNDRKSANAPLILSFSSIIQ